MLFSALAQLEGKHSQLGLTETTGSFRKGSTKASFCSLLSLPKYIICRPWSQDEA